MLNRVLRYGRQFNFLGSATQARPGSPEKIQVMKRRVQRGQQIFHPGDATISDYDQWEERSFLPSADEDVEDPIGW